MSQRISSSALEPDRKADHLRQNAGRALLVFVELAMRRRGRMDHQRLRVADVGEVRQELHRLDEALAGLRAALDAEGEYARRAPRGR